MLHRTYVKLRESLISLRLDLLKNRFCRVPFENLEISYEQEGKIPCHTCCFNWLPEIAGDLNQESLKEIWNSQKMQDIRKSILDGSYSYCSSEFCPEIQSQSLPLKSSIQEPYLKDIIEKEKVYLEEGPKVINMAMDRTCNLECPSCRPEKIVANKEQQERFTKLYQVNLDEVVPHLERLNCCSSGDPFASKVYRTFLKELNIPKDSSLKIQLNTNGVLFDEQAWSELKNIHQNISQVLISMDAAREETYNIVRKGGDFKRLLDNIEFLVKKRDEGLIDYIRLDFVVQQKNYREIPEFISLGKKLGVDHVYFQKINDWGTFPPGVFEKQAVYKEDHPEFEFFLNVLKGEELLDEIVAPGNLGGFLSSHHLSQVQSHNITKKLQSIIEAPEKESIDKYWAKFHLESSLQKTLVFASTFELEKMPFLESFFHQQLKNMEEGQIMSILGNWDSPFNRFLSQGQRHTKFDRSENVWQKEFVEKENKSLAWILNRSPNQQLETIFPKFRITSFSLLSPIDFFEHQKGKTLPRPLKGLLKLMVAPFLPLFALHCHYTIEKLDE